MEMIDLKNIKNKITKHQYENLIVEFIAKEEIISKWKSRNIIKKGDCITIRNTINGGCQCISVWNRSEHYKNFDEYGRVDNFYKENEEKLKIISIKLMGE